MKITNSDPVDSKLSQTCFIRPTYNFSADKDFIDRRIGRLKLEKLKAVLETLTAVLNKAD